MLAILFAHAAAAAVAPVLVRRWGRQAFYPLALVPLGSLVWVARTGRVSPVRLVPCASTGCSELSMDIDFRFDTLAAIMSVLVLGIGGLVLFYCGEYFHHHDGHTEKRLPSFAAELVAFSGAMFGLVISDNMLMLYLFWELTTVLSFLLVGHYAERATSRRAATQALLVTTAGGLAMLVGIVILGQVSGTYLLSELVAAPPSGVAASVGVVLVLIGALSKSAIVPMHFWLPGAMAAPTPVSAYLHAAAMVKAGVYLVARMTPGFADAPPWRPVIVTLGLLTMLLAGWRAVREYDLKLILAFGTVSQLGLITLMVGAGGGDLMLAGLSMLCAHAMFKAALFMVVGIIDHATGTRDIRRLSGLGAHNKPLLHHRARRDGEHGRAAAVSRVRRQGGRLRNPRAQCVARQCGTVRVGRRGVRFGVHHDLQPALHLRGVRGQGQAPTQPARRRNAAPCTGIPGRTGHPGGGAACCSASGPPGLDHVLDSYADTVPGGTDYHLALWHGVNLPLLLSILVLASASRSSPCGPGCPGCGRVTCRWATPTGSTTQSSAAPTCSPCDSPR